MRIHLPWITNPFVALALMGCTTAHTRSNLLDNLALELAAAHRSADIRLVECPHSADSLIGMPREIVVSKLGTPDGTYDGKEWYSFVKHLDDSGYWKAYTDKDGIEHIILPPHGGWTILSFAYDSNGSVVRAECHYTR